MFVQVPTSTEPLPPYFGKAAPCASLQVCLKACLYHAWAVSLKDAGTGDTLVPTLFHFILVSLCDIVALIYHL